MARVEKMKAWGEERKDCRTGEGISGKEEDRVSVSGWAHGRQCADACRSQRNPPGEDGIHTVSTEARGSAFREIFPGACQHAPTPMPIKRTVPHRLPNIWPLYRIRFFSTPRCASSSIYTKGIRYFLQGLCDRRQTPHARSTRGGRDRSWITVPEKPPPGNVPGVPQDPSRHPVEGQLFSKALPGTAQVPSIPFPRALQGAGVHDGDRG